MIVQIYKDVSFLDTVMPRKISTGSTARNNHFDLINISMIFLARINVKMHKESKTEKLNLPFFEIVANSVITVVRV